MSQTGFAWIKRHSLVKNWAGLPWGTIRETMNFLAARTAVVFDAGVALENFTNMLFFTIKPFYSFSSWFKRSTMSFAANTKRPLAGNDCILRFNFWSTLFFECETVIYHFVHAVCNVHPVMLPTHRVTPPSLTWVVCHHRVTCKVLESFHEFCATIFCVAQSFDFFQTTILFLSAMYPALLLPAWAAACLENGSVACFLGNSWEVNALLVSL